MARGGGLDIGTLSGFIELVDNVSPTLEVIGGRIDNLDKRFGGFGGRLAETAAGFFTAEIALNGISRGIELAVQTLKDLTVEGAAVSDVVENFEHLTTQAGRLSSTLLNELREGTHNTIDDFELIKIANADLAAGMNLTDEQFRTLADGAFALAQATGRDVATSLETMNQALLTGRTISIQALTGKINLVEAEEKYAKQLGVSVDMLTEEGKQYAKQLTILESVQNAVERLGDQTDGLDELVAQAQTTWANFQHELGATVATSPVLIAGFQAARDAIMDAFGANQGDLIETIRKQIEELAIGTVEFAQTVVDGIGIAGMTWNSFKIILETSAQGFRAITYVVEEVLLGLTKLANFTSGGLLFGDAIKTLEADVDRLYNAMAEGEAQLESYAMAKDEWAVSTGRVNEALEKVRQRMIDAQQAALGDAEATRELKEETQAVAVATEQQAEAQEAATHVMTKSREEAKKQAAALAELESISVDYKMTVSALDSAMVKSIKTYLDAGVAQGTLAAAYGLTASQLAAINKEHAEEVKLLDEAKKKAKERSDALAELKDLTQDYRMILREVNRETQNQAKEWLALGASSRTVQTALGLTDTQMRALQRTMGDTEKGSKRLGDALRTNVGGAADEVSQKVRTLSGEFLTLEEYQAKQNAPSSYSIHRGNLLPSLNFWGIPENIGFEMAKKGASFQEILAAWQSKSWRDWVPHGPRIPGFKEGGYGDFGTGTLAMLHGKELITPIDKVGKTFGDVNNYFYVNGTAEETARKVSTIIMRQLKNTRQFGAA